jgi:tRNA (cytidine56-2'-O)-methyltransferase
MITVLRLGHRPDRDKRITTHVALVARAFGADRVLISNKDEGIESTLRDVCRRFGGDIHIETGVSWRPVLKSWEGTSVHLTMYGEHIGDCLDRIPKDRDLLIVVGSEKVPREVYDLVDFNVAVGNQPHSEVSALAVFLDRYLGGEGLRRQFEGKVVIEPNPRGKTVTERD